MAESDRFSAEYITRTLAMLGLHVAGLAHQFKHDPYRDELAITLTDGTVGLVTAEDYTRDADSALRDAFLCSRCDCRFPPNNASLRSVVISEDRRARRFVCDRCADGLPKATGTIRCGDTALAVTDIVHHGRRHGKSAASAALVSQAREAGHDVAELKRKAVGEHNRDIRAGDLVEVVECLHFPQAEGKKARVIATTQFGGSTEVISALVGFGDRRFALTGKFRIVERDGKPYGRSPISEIPLSVVVYENGKIVRYPLGTGLPVDAKAENTKGKCPWHDHDAHEFDVGSMCTVYQRALEKRLATGGAYDTKEERESVRRFVDARRPPERERCACGADAFVPPVPLHDGKKSWDACLDCAVTNFCGTGEPYEHDPTKSWSAGETPGWSWP